MGLIQEIEGLLGFGKKSTQTSQDATAVKNAIGVVQGFLNQLAALIAVLTPFLADIPALAGFLSILKVVESLAQSALTELQSLVPAAPAPAPAPPANPPA